MTRAEWLALLQGRTQDQAFFEAKLSLEEKLISLNGKTSERKLRLSCCACMRQVLDRLDGVAEALMAVEVAEELADGLRTAEELEQVARAITVTSQVYENDVLRAVASCVDPCVTVLDVSRVFFVAERLLAEIGEGEAEALARSGWLMWEVSGDPYCPVTFDPNWRTSTAVALAAQMYDSRDFSAMPILADALQDAGCDNADILDHCRGTGPHVRGCWVVDLVLGKE
jgi:hypothetical protein